MRIAWLAAILLAALLGSSAARASNCATEEYNHNNSVMEVFFCDEGLNIAYLHPRESIRRRGARSGTLLFEGNWLGDDTLRGYARLFSADCGEILYEVTGGVEGSTIRLFGQAPVRDSSCNVVRYRADELVFTARRGAGGAPRTGDWYAVAGTFGSRLDAMRRANELGPDRWIAMNTGECPNFRNGLWIAASGPFSRADAQRLANSASHFGAYIKSCH